MSEIMVDKLKVNENVVANKANLNNTKTNEVDTSWEFFKMRSGVVTDYMQKMINIPSTFFTPAFVEPSKAFFKDAVQTLALIKAVLHKFRQINDVIDKNKKKTSERKKIARLSILNSLEKSKWEVKYHKKEK